MKEVNDVPYPPLLPTLPVSPSTRTDVPVPANEIPRPIAYRKGFSGEIESQSNYRTNRREKLPVIDRAFPKRRSERFFAIFSRTFTTKPVDGRINDLSVTTTEHAITMRHVLIAVVSPPVPSICPFHRHRASPRRAMEVSLHGCCVSRRCCSLFAVGFFSTHVYRISQGSSHCRSLFWSRVAQSDRLP